MKVTEAAAQVMERSLPALVAGTAPRIRQNLADGGYFGGRKPADGCINWLQTATRVHNLVRGVAPPYPGAFTHLGGGTLKILRTKIDAGVPADHGTPLIFVRNNACFATCADGTTLRLLEMEFEGRPFSAGDFLARFGDNPVPLEILQQ
jgi:methionyl-tRNA formyltransferase